MVENRIFLRVLVISLLSIGFGSYLIYLLESKRETETRSISTLIAATHAKALEKQLTRSLSATYALAAFLEQNKTISDFDVLAQDLIDKYGGISNLQLAPKAIVSKIFPLEGNQAAIGHDLNSNPFANAAIKSRQLSLEGPIDLIQGGVAVIGRYPVFVPNEGTGKDDFWGFTTVLIELSKLLEAVDIHGLISKNYHFELCKFNIETGQKEVFSKSNNNILKKPVSVDIQIPNGKWILSVVPKAGWSSPYFLLIEVLLVLVFSGALSFVGYRSLRKKQELIAKTNDYSLIFNSTPAFIFYKDGQNNILRVNKATADSLNLESGDIEGKSTKEFFPDHYESYYADDLEVIHSGKPKLGIIEPYRLKSGETRWVQTDKVPCLGKNGDIKGILSFSVDITRQKEAENKLLEYSNNLEKAAETTLIKNREKFRLLYNQISDLLQGTSSATSGENYFQSLVYHLSNILEFSFCCIGRLDQKNKTIIHALALVQDGEYVHNLQYELRDTPCELIFEGAAVYYSGNLQKNFPRDDYFKKHGLNSYFGVPIFGKDGQPIAHLVVMDRKQKDYTAHVFSILSLFAARAEAEIIRMGIKEELKISHKRMRELNKKLQSVREDEKLHLAREIHDELGQVLTFCKLDLQWIRKMIKKPGQKIENKFDAMIDHLDDSINRIRRISSELRPEILDVLGISEAIKWQAQKFHDQTQIEFELNILPEKIKCERDLSIDLFRIFQEALTNITRHAQATSIFINFVQKEKEYKLVVKDDGKGFDATQATHFQSLGILGMAERARNWGGQVDIQSEPGLGTTITVILPIKGNQDHKSSSTPSAKSGPLEVKVK